MQRPSVSIRGLNDIFSEIFAHLAPLIQRGHGCTRMGIRSDGSRDWRCLRGGERALIHELALRGVSAKAQVSFPVSYKGKYLGEYAADPGSDESRS